MGGALASLPLRRLVGECRPRPFAPSLREGTSSGDLLRRFLTSTAYGRRLRRYTAGTGWMALASMRQIIPSGRESPTDLDDPIARCPGTPPSRPSGGADARRDHCGRRPPPVGFCTVWASAASTTSRGAFVRSAAQSRKLDRNPCGTAAMPSSLVNLGSRPGYFVHPRRMRPAYAALR